MDEQALLLQIVKSWNISPTPEYRGFRCAVCQEYRNEAWHHWLRSGGFLVPVHLCDETCEQALKEGSLSLAPAHQTTATALPNSYSPKAMETFEELIEEWNTLATPVLKAFTCDMCERELEIDSTDGLRKGVHVWYQMKNQNNAELHFHSQCAETLAIK